ncbi:MAG: hypothetical protein ACM3NV_00715, partial [Syntrophothermus sp.]
GIPGVPHVKLPPPDQTAVFDVVVEGKATDDLTSTLSGETGPCLATEDGTVKDTTTYRRGRGVALEFDRYGPKILVHRVGRRTDASLAVKVTTERTASGGSSFSPAHPPLPCEIPPYQLSSNADCNRPLHSSGAMLMTYAGRGLGLEVSRSTRLRGGFSEDECGGDPQTGVSDPFTLAWPNSPKLEPSPGVTRAEIFGRKPVIVVQLRSSDVGKRKEATQKWTSFTLNGTVHEAAFNEATVRLIRHRP